MFPVSNKEPKFNTVSNKEFSHDLQAELNQTTDAHGIMMELSRQNY
jgi:hypothetical protein